MEQKKLEDSILKQASELFSQELLPYFGIHEKVTAIEPTELITITLNRQNMDFNYLTETGIIHHFEFQSTDAASDDCRRFRAYEAIMSMKTGKTVITHVIYSGNVRHPVSRFRDGMNIYRVDAISLKTMDADGILARIMEKADKEIPLERADMLSLVLLPVMGGKTGRMERIRDSILLLKKAEVNHFEEPEREKVQALIYAFAEKFLTGGELERIREVLHMTRLGQMLRDDGIKEGMEKGIERGREEGIRILIEDNLEEGIGKERILLKLQNRYALDAGKAEEYFQQYGY